MNDYFIKSNCELLDSKQISNTHKQLYFAIYADTDKNRLKLTGTEITYNKLDKDKKYSFFNCNLNDKNTKQIHKQIKINIDGKTNMNELYLVICRANINKGNWDFITEKLNIDDDIEEFNEFTEFDDEINTVLFPFIMGKYASNPYEEFPESNTIFDFNTTIIKKLEYYKIYRIKLNKNIEILINKNIDCMRYQEGEAIDPNWYECDKINVDVELKLQRTLDIVHNKETQNNHLKLFELEGDTRGWGTWYEGIQYYFVNYVE